MKKLNIHPRLVSMVASKIFSRCIVGLMFLLLWKRFWSKGSYMALIEGGMLLLVGAIYLGMAWFNYLKLDGVGSRIFKKRPKKLKAKKHHIQKEMVDYVQEEPDFLEQIDDHQLTVCNLISNLTSAVIFIVPSLVLSFR